MKLSILLPTAYLLLLNLTHLVGQTDAYRWGANNAVWQYVDVEFIGIVGMLTVRVEGDTMILGKRCQVFSKHLTNIFFDRDEYREEYLAPDFMYQDGQVVYLYNSAGEHFDTLHNFGAVPGDSWHIYRRDRNEEQYPYVRHVIDTTSKLIKGTLRRALVVHDFPRSTNSSNYPKDTLVEGIGNLYLHYYPWSFGIAAYDGLTEANYFCSYQDDVIGSYSSNNSEYLCNEVPQKLKWGAAKWTYRYSDFGRLGVTEMESGPGFHVLDSVTLTPLYIRQLWNSTNLTSTWIELDTLLVAFNDHFVQLYNDENRPMQILYHFDQDPGFTWHLEESTLGTIQAEILENDFVVVDDHPARTARIRYTLGESYYEDVIIEGIGSLSEFFLPWEYFRSQREGHMTGPLRCFNNAIISFHRKEIDDCIPSTLLNTAHHLDPAFRLTPNPASNELMIFHEQQNASTYLIWSLTGLVEIKQLINDHIKIDHLLPGTYTLQLLDKNQNLGSVRFVKM